MLERETVETKRYATRVTSARGGELIVRVGRRDEFILHPTPLRR